MPRTNRKKQAAFMAFLKKRQRQGGKKTGKTARGQKGGRKKQTGRSGGRRQRGRRRRRRKHQLGGTLIPQSQQVLSKMQRSGWRQGSDISRFQAELAARLGKHSNPP